MAADIERLDLHSVRLPARWTASELSGEPQPATHGKAKHTPPSRHPQPPATASSAACPRTSAPASDPPICLPPCAAEPAAEEAAAAVAGDDDRWEELAVLDEIIAAYRAERLAYELRYLRAGLDEDDIVAAEDDAADARRDADFSVARLAAARADRAAAAAMAEAGRAEAAVTGEAEDEASAAQLRAWEARQLAEKAGVLLEQWHPTASVRAAQAAARAAARAELRPVGGGDAAMEEAGRGAEAGLAAAVAGMQVDSGPAGETYMLQPLTTDEDLGGGGGAAPTRKLSRARRKAAKRAATKAGREIPEV